MFRIWLEYIKKMIINPIFPISVVIGTVIYMTGNIYMDDMGTGYSLFSVLFSGERVELIEMIGKTSCDVMMEEDKSYMWMFAVILTSLPYISVISAGSINSSLRFELIRCNRGAYCRGLVLAVITVAGLIMVASYAAYMAVVSVVLPEGEAGVSLTGFMLKRFAGMFVYGIESVCASLLLSAFVRNRYLVACIPFMLKYLICMEIGELTMKLGQAGEPKTAMLLTYVVPESVKNILFVEREQFNMMSGVAAGLVVMSYAVYRISMEKRWDCGE